MRHVLQPKIVLGGGIFAALPLALAGLVVSASLALACDKVPQPVKNLDLARFYSDAAGSVIDPQLASQHKKEIEPLKSFLNHVVKDADQAVKSHDAAHGECAVKWIRTWAEGDAWLGKITSKQAEYQRKWDLAGVALAYVKVKPYATQADRAAIEPWLIRFADACLAFFDDRSHKRNNQWYWLGLGLAGTSLATGSERHWTAARGAMADAANDIAANGTLPEELARERRALHYHAFALTPLAVLAELGHAKGEDWFALKNRALDRLVDVTRRGLSTPEVFDKLAGTRQEHNVQPGYGWHAVYKARFPDKVGSDWPQVPDSYRWLGGDVKQLIKAVETTGKS